MRNFTPIGCTIVDICDLEQKKTESNLISDKSHTCRPTGTAFVDNSTVRRAVSLRHLLRGLVLLQLKTFTCRAVLAGIRFFWRILTHTISHNYDNCCSNRPKITRLALVYRPTGCCPESTVHLLITVKIMTGRCQ